MRATQRAKATKTALIAGILAIVAAGCTGSASSNQEAAALATRYPSSLSSSVPLPTPTPTESPSPYLDQGGPGSIVSRLSPGDYVVFCADDPASQDPRKPFTFFYMTREGNIKAAGPAVENCFLSLLSPTGRFLEWEPWASPLISVLDLETGDQHALASSTGCDSPLWSPDEKSLLARCDEHPNDYVALEFFGTTSPLGIDLSDLGACGGLSMSPDGLAVAITCSSAPYPVTFVYATWLECADAVASCSHEWHSVAVDAAGPIAWSPDGKILVAEWEDSKETTYLALFDPWGQAAIPIRSLLRIKSLGAVAWSPDGQSIAFVDDFGDDSGPLKIIPSAGGETRMLQPIVQASQVLWIRVP